jgi:ABC-type branched-subunit amino acid transport system substrate-binding protein
MATAVTAIALGAASFGGYPGHSRRTAIGIGPLFRTLPYALSSGIAVTAGSLKAWLPPQRVAVVDDDGIMSEPWYRFFQYVANVRLGGPTGGSVKDLSATLSVVKSQAVAASASTVALAAQTSTNAEALEAVRQVAVQNSLAGAAQIPVVNRSGVRLLIE